MNKKILIIAVIIIIIAGGIGTYKIFYKNNQSNTEKILYTCPMHHQIISDHPGQCPICGMDLVLKTENNENISQTKSDQDSSNINLSDVKLSPSQQVLANVQTEKVKTKVFSGEKTFNGYVKIDDKNYAHLSTPVSGRIEKMYVDFEGQYVSKGEPIIEIYSPELVSTQKEYLLALDNYDKIKQSSSGFAIEQAEGLVSSAKQRLSNWEFSSSQLEALGRSKDIFSTVTIHARYSGYIMKRYVNVGHWAMAGEDIYDIANLSTVWVIANVYESDISLIKTGQTAEITSTAFPDEPIAAKINYINPIFNPDSRTLEVRFEVSNKNNRLKPDMFVSIKINTYSGVWIAVPKNAIIRTGEKNIVYIEKEKGIYEPRNVQIGEEQGGYYAVTSGLKEGEVVVSSGGFLIDSETEIETGQQTGGHDMNNMSNDEDKPKINPDQDIMKDMEK